MGVKDSGAVTPRMAKLKKGNLKQKRRRLDRRREALNVSRVAERPPIL